MESEKILELQLLLSILNEIDDVDYEIVDGKKQLLSYWGDKYDLSNMQERANSLLKEFLQPYVINSISKE